MSNPFAYFEEELPANSGMAGFDESVDTGEGVLHEPRMPISLRLRRGWFGKMFLLEANRGQCDISGESLPEPIVVPREDALNRIRLKNTKMIVSDSDGRKYSFRYVGDKYQGLKRARLETWAKRRWDDASGPAYQWVRELLKKNVIYPVMRSMIALTVLQGVFVLLIAFAFLAAFSRGDEFLIPMIFGVFFYAIPPMVTLALAVALWLRQIWAIYATAIFSFFPLMLGIVTFFLPIINPQNNAVGNFSMYVAGGFLSLIAFAVIGCCFRAILRYHRQSYQLERDNRAPVNTTPPSAGLFDKDNQINIRLE